MLPVERELAAFKFIEGLSTHLKDVREPHKALRHGLRDTREFFGASQADATLRAGRSEADLLFTLPKLAGWDLGVLTRFIRHTHRPVQRDMLIGAVRRRGGTWGAIALVGPDRGFDREDRRRSRASRRSCQPPFIGSTAIDSLACAIGSTGRSWSTSIPRSLLPDPGRHPIADPVRLLVGAPHPRRRRGIAACGGGTDSVDESQGRADRRADSITEDAAALLQSERVYGSIATATVGVSGTISRWEDLRRCSTTTGPRAPQAGTFGRRRCSVCR